MPSNSLTKWCGERQAALDEIENAHAAVGGVGRGRRHATLQINYAYAAILSSQFQGFCRDLHSECVEHIVAVVPANLRTFLRAEFLFNRTLDRGNPHPGGIGSDFNRLGVVFWPGVLALDARNADRKASLQRLIDWRNAIAHQDFGPVGGDARLRLADVRAWRRAATALADEFDRAMGDYLSALLGAVPW